MVTVNATSLHKASQTASARRSSGCCMCSYDNAHNTNTWLLHVLHPRLTGANPLLFSSLLLCLFSPVKGKPCSDAPQS